MCTKKNIYISSPKTNGLNPPKIGCFADVSPFLPRRVHFQGACVLLFPVVFLTNIRFLKSLKRGKKSGSWCFKPESCSCSYCRWVVGSALVVPVVGPSNTKYRSPMTADHWWELRLQRWQLRQKRNGGKMVCRFFFWGCLQKGMEMLVFVVWRGALLTCFLEVVEILFDVMCFFFRVGLFCGAFWALNTIFLHSERKNEKDCQTDPGQLWVFLRWFWWCEFSIYSIRWTEMGFKRIPSPPGKGKKWSNKKKSTWNFRSNFRSSKTWAVFMMGSIFPSIPRKGWGIRGVIDSTPPHDQLTQIGGSNFDSSQWVVVWYCRCVHKCWDVWRNESDRPVVFFCFCKGNWWGGKLENSKFQEVCWLLKDGKVKPLLENWFALKKLW